MIVYFLAFFLVGIVSKLYARTGETFQNRGKRQAYFIFVVIVLLLGLRHPSMGNDLRFGRTNGYLWAFETIASVPFSEVIHWSSFLNYERGYVLFNKILSYISNDSQCLILACAIFSIFPITWLMKKHSKDIAFSSLVFMGLPVFLMMYSGLRQGIAIGICCFAYDAIIERKPIKFVLIVLLASLFHSSALFFIVAYPMYTIRLYRWNKLFPLLVVGIAFVFRTRLFTFFAYMFRDNVNIYSNGSTTLLIVFVGVFYFVSMFLDDEDKVSEGLNSIFLLACIFQCFGEVNNLVMRIGYYFMLSAVITVPNTIMQLKNENNFRLLFPLVQAIFTLYGLYAIANSTWAMAYPYMFFWQ